MRKIRYDAGRIFKPEHFMEVKKWLAVGKTTKQVMSITGWKRGTVDYVRASNNYEEYKALRHKQTEQILDLRRRRKEQNQPINSISQVSDLETEINKLDDLIDQLKTTIETVVILSVDQKVADYKREKEAEIVALKTVVDAAKKNNLASMLKHRLMGD